MKPFEQQTYYELLEVPVSASAEEIRVAYVRALEAYGPDSVAVYALEDPNPQVAGQGAARLRDSGIAVDCGLMAAEAEALNPGYLRRRRTGAKYSHSASNNRCLKWP